MKNFRLICVLALILSAGLVGCADPEYTAAKKNGFYQCRDNGGIPIISWLEDRISDCVFPPRKAN